MTFETDSENRGVEFSRSLDLRNVTAFVKQDVSDAAMSLRECERAQAARGGLCESAGMLLGRNTYWLSAQQAIRSALSMACCSATLLSQTRRLRP